MCSVVQSSGDWLLQNSITKLVPFIIRDLINSEMATVCESRGYAKLVHS